MRRAFYAAVLAALAGCGPKPIEFPVGFYGVETPSDARKLAAEGFDAVQGYAAGPGRLDALFRETRRQGQLLLTSPDGAMREGRSASDFPGAVWYIQDEPDVAGIPNAELSRRDAAVKAWARGGLTAFVVGDGRRARDFPGTADVIMVDWYPVPHLPLESAGDHVRMTAEAAGGRKVWAVLQAFDWRSFPQRTPKKPRVGRFPDLAEIRFMSYDAVINGAQGIWYYAYSTAPASNLSQTPELMLAVGEPAREIRAMAPIFARGRKIPLPYPPDPDGLAARAWTYHGRDYVLLANRRSGVDTAVPDEMLRPEWRPLFVQRRDPRESLREYKGRYYLLQHQVMVFESRLRLKRLFGL